MILLSCFVDFLTWMVAHEASKPVQGFSSCWHCFNGVVFLIFIFNFNFRVLFGSLFGLIYYCDYWCRRERMFFSSVIVKRHEPNVVETEDGVTIIIRGFINSSRTSQNGFPSDVGYPFSSWFHFTLLYLYWLVCTILKLILNIFSFFSSMVRKYYFEILIFNQNWVVFKMLCFDTLK
jgi:hypothetical protein